MFLDENDRLAIKHKKTIIYSFILGILLLMLFITLVFVLKNKNNNFLEEKLFKINEYSTKDGDEKPGWLGQLIEDIAKKLGDMIKTIINAEYITKILFAILYEIAVAPVIILVSGFSSIMQIIGGEAFISILFSDGDFIDGLPNSFIIMMVFAPMIFLILILIQAILILCDLSGKRRDKVVKSLGGGAKAAALIIGLPCAFFMISWVINIIILVMNKAIISSDIADQKYFLGDAIFKTGFLGSAPDLNGDSFSQRYFVDAFSKIINSKESYLPFMSFILAITIGFSIAGLAISIFKVFYELFILFLFGIIIIPTYVLDNGKKFAIYKNQVIGKFWVIGVTLVGWNAFLGFYPIILNGINKLVPVSILEFKMLVTAAVLTAGVMFTNQIPTMFAAYTNESVGQTEGVNAIKNKYNSSQQKVKSVVGKFSGSGKKSDSGSGRVMGSS
ncbi:hypothetical protein SCORR_v1c10330 (plasmid) [Spiroplasma corruscae]|uniref:Uncharacterized protein n=1 Tax=Spiroplasma corruscae TaxID=216934 RepID=A0A222EQE3_9MOLU|nr:hypothetical protein [Spiroplasma corruscae]ASP28805.1 hypothetical protein SCORR_v1c10330 [Spiroplasma corruscae]